MIIKDLYIFLIYVKKRKVDESYEYAIFNYRTTIQIFNTNFLIESFSINTKIDFLNQIEANEKGSNWVFEKINEVKLSLSKVKKRFGGSYIETPEFIKNKKAIINPKNKNDNFCIIWCLLIHKYYNGDRYKNEIGAYKKHFTDIIIPEGIKFPIEFGNEKNSIRDIILLEKANNIKINVFYEDKEKIYPRYINKIIDNDILDTINLLVLQDENKNYFTYIKNIDRLLHKTGVKHKYYICDNCINSKFQTKEKLEEHKIICYNNECTTIKMPKENKNIMKFENLNHTFKHPFYIVADFESTLKPYEESKEKIIKCNENNELEYEKQKQ